MVVTEHRRRAEYRGRSELVQCYRASSRAIPPQRTLDVGAHAGERAAEKTALLDEENLGAAFCGRGAAARPLGPDPTTRTSVAWFTFS